MSPADKDLRETQEEVVASAPDPLTPYLRAGVGFLILSIVCAVLYGVLTGVFGATAPRTMVESLGSRSQAAIAESPGNGIAWSALAGSQWAGGDTAAAWRTLEEAKKNVTDHSIIYVHTRELELLLAEGRNEEALQRGIEYVTAEEEYRTKEAADLAARSINVPTGMADYGETVRLYVLKAAAEGNLGQWDDAIATLDFAVELEDTASDVVTLRGWAKLNSGDVAGAKADFETALRYWPNYDSALSGLEAVAQAETAQ